MTWEEKHETAEKKLTLELFDYLAKNDAENIKRAAEHAKQGSRKSFKDVVKSLEPTKENLKGAVKGVVETLVPGAGIAKELRDGIDKTLVAAYGKAKLHTNSCKKGPSDAEPFNYLANFFAEVLGKKAKAEETAMFIKWHTSMYAMALAGPAASAATAPAAGSLGSAAATGLGNLLEWGIGQGADVVADIASSEIIDHITSGSKKSKVGPLAWAVYLSGTPRKKRAPTSTVENCRLALRIILGMSIDQTSYRKAEDGRFLPHPGPNKPVVTPWDRCELLSEGNFTTNVMIKGDVKKNFAKIARFNDLGTLWKKDGKPDDGYDYAKPDAYKNELTRYHLTYLQFMLVGLGLKECLEGQPFTLK
jgi:hypothetical protein